jgi:tryptophan synthase alpha subunit
MGQPRYDAVRNQYVYGADSDADVANLVDGAVTHAEGVHAITKASIAALTLSAPTAAEEGMRLIVVSRTAFAHVVTVAGGAGFTTITYGAIGDCVELLADNLKWCPTGAAFRAVIS